MTEIRWEGPPPDHVTHNWSAIAVALRSRPGEWAVVATCANANLAGSTARYVRESQYQPLYGATYEARARTVAGEHRVYARFIGEAVPDAAG